jgi:phosphoglycerol transferase MdoB-like AlkP superfamily enzyme
MKFRLFFVFKYLLFWISAFVIAKLVFLFYQHSQSFSLPARTWLQIFLHGFRLDLSTASYFTLLPCMVLAFASFSKSKVVVWILHIYTLALLLVFLLITCVDMEVYKYWGVRLDSTPLRFLSRPKETLASSSLITLVLYFIALITFTWLLFRIYRRQIARFLENSDNPGFKGLLTFLFLAAFLIIPVRGGLGVSPLNTGTVYFNKVAFANHSAINVVWNFGQSLIEHKETVNPYNFYKKGTYENDLKALYTNNDSTLQALNTKRPNIVLIIMESFSAKLIEPLGGAKGVTPQFNALCKEGVLFSNVYSTDSRTDKGLATVVSGYPVLEAIPILQYAEKTQNLPFLSKSLEKYGYHTSFLYGGDVDFANMRSYLHNGQFGNIESDTDFPSALRTGKWGVPDHYVFQKFFEDIKADTGTWFKVLLTLSNHEPFEIPVKPRYGNRNLTEKFYSSANYVDSCLGNFIQKLKDSGLWKNTLIIMVADHGSRLPDFSDIFEPRKHHIPLLWAGGAIVNDTVIAKIGSQADIAVTLLHQLGIPSQEYVLGKNLLAPSSKSFAFYSFKNGISMLTDSGGFGYDFTTKGLSYSYGSIDSSHIRIARSFQQYVFQNYLELSKR